MCTIVEARLPTEQFALYETLREVPDATFESVRVSAAGSDQLLLPFLRGSADADVDLTGPLARDPTTERVDRVADSADGSLFRLEWAPAVRITLRIILEQDATLLDARGADGSWWFRLLFPDHEHVGATDAVCEEHDIDLEPERVYQLSEFVEPERLGITGQQLEAIQVAYESGYYEVPRQVTLKDLAGKTDVSHQALSERFRRGHSTLIENALVRRNI